MGFFLKTCVLCVALLMTSAGTLAAIEIYEFDTDLQRQRYQSFIDEMRCPKCQNQNLAGSNSLISTDLRRELYEMIALGKSDKEIVDFMVERYGDFILYRPRVTPATYLLWGAPVALLVMGAMVLIFILHRRRHLALTQTMQQLSSDEKVRLDALLSVNTKTNDNTEKNEEPPA